MKLVVDMNLAPAWVEFLVQRGHTAVHWSAVGDPRAKDVEIVAWARSAGAVVLTADLDFAAILAMTAATGPSVVLVRVHDALPAAVGEVVARELTAHEVAIVAGAIVTIDVGRARVRVLPIQRG